MRKCFVFVWVMQCCLYASANITLPKIFSNNMVMQREISIPVWGWAEPGEKVSVMLNSQKRSTVAGKNGRWKVTFDPLKAGGPYQIVIEGKNKITLDNILIGEVWICSGQSNMEMPIAGWGKIINYKKEIAEANYAQIRQFNVEKATSSYPLDSVGGEWMLCNPDNAGNFIATGYFFARELYRKLNVPVGIINSSWGGSMIETWISRDALQNSDEFKNMISGVPAANIDLQSKQKNESLQKAITVLQGSLPTKAETEKWKNLNFEDDRWPEITLPGYWEKQNSVLNQLDGEVWFRKTIILDKSAARLAGTISLGRPDDAAEIFLNTVKLDEKRDSDAQFPSYGICPGIMKAGENIITLRIQDFGGLGGILGEANRMYLKIDSTIVSLQGLWKYQVEAVSNYLNPNSYPTLLYNSMVHPLIPFAIRGAIWYQGETNAGRAEQYRKTFPLMINDWRGKWGQGDFPFYFVQLSSFEANGGNSTKGSSWAELREAQAMTAELNNTGMAVTIDIGDAKDIHPKNKQEVGKRLAAVALAHTYGANITYSGPEYTSMNKDGDKIILSFNHINGGLITKDKYGYLKGFEVSGEDKKFHWAKALIWQDKVIVGSDNVKNPIAVRYAWADNPDDANLFNAEGFPAAPFRTDTWPGTTDGVKFEVSK